MEIYVQEVTALTFLPRLPDDVKQHVFAWAGVFAAMVDKAERWHGVQPPSFILEVLSGTRRMMHGFRGQVYAGTSWGWPLLVSGIPASYLLPLVHQMQKRCSLKLCNLEESVTMHLEAFALPPDRARARGRF